MEFPRPCGCKGCRTCLICEKEFGIEEKSFIHEYRELSSYVFCPECNQIYPGDDVKAVLNNHPAHESDENGIKFPGMYVDCNFINEDEQKELLKGIDHLKWDISQSGRRKQQYGPKANFKKRKLAHGNFRGFPVFSKFIQDRFDERELMKNFHTIEQCSLEYDPSKGASIDPHIDDCWIWGERVVTVNCLADSVLTLVRYKGDSKRYNLNMVESYEDALIEPLATEDELSRFNGILVKVPMPSGSLIVMYGPARYQFEHSVLRDDIESRRVCIAYREPTPMYLNSGCHADQGEPILRTAKQFWVNEID